MIYATKSSKFHKIDQHNNSMWFIQQKSSKCAQLKTWTNSYTHDLSKLRLINIVDYFRDSIAKPKIPQNNKTLQSETQLTIAKPKIPQIQ
jgi:uncharacterized protein (DUF2461 family)